MELSFPVINSSILRKIFANFDYSLPKRASLVICRERVLYRSCCMTAYSTIYNPILYRNLQVIFLPITYTTSSKQTISPKRVTVTTVIHTYCYIITSITQCADNLVHALPGIIMI